MTFTAEHSERCVEVLGLAKRGGLLRTGISMCSTEGDVRRLLQGMEMLTGKG
ncbi:MAG TPA: hypothetical protein VNR70_01190 [Steroidobacteraceae bacterium]|nr:hypothetical protein [Steroidobacteraceae bacterium]